MILSIVVGVAWWKEGKYGESKIRKQRKRLIMRWGKGEENLGCKRCKKIERQDLWGGLL